MLRQALFIFKCFAAMIAKESFLLSVGSCVALQKLWTHLPHLYGFSPVCTLLMLIVNWLVVMLEKPHCEHL